MGFRLVAKYYYSADLDTRIHTWSPVGIQAACKLVDIRLPCPFTAWIIRIQVLSDVRVFASNYFHVHAAFWTNAKLKLKSPQRIEMTVVASVRCDYMNYILTELEACNQFHMHMIQEEIKSLPYEHCWTPMIQYTYRKVMYCSHAWL